jgi:cold shock protein
MVMVIRRLKRLGRGLSNAVRSANRQEKLHFLSTGPMPKSLSSLSTDIGPLFAPPFVPIQPRRSRDVPLMAHARISLGLKDTHMITGTVKFFNADKGYGFIAPENGQGDAFVHISAVERAGMTTLDKDQRISYELETDNRGKTSAVNLQAA